MLRESSKRYVLAACLQVEVLSVHLIMYKNRLFATRD